MTDYWTYVGRLLALFTVLYAVGIGLALAFLVGRAVL